MHTLHEERDLNDYSGLFDHLPTAKPDPEMIQLATQFIDRQTGTYDPADVEDRYETRLRAVTEAKLKDEGIKPEAAEEPDRGNVVDLMATLRKSLGQSTADAPAAKKGTTKVKAASKTAAAPEAKSGKKAAETPSAPIRATRKRA